MSTQQHWPVSVIGSGNIGTDLMVKILQDEGPLSMAAMVGIDPESDGLGRAHRMGVPTTAAGIDGLLAMPNFGDIKLVFDATSAGAHRENWSRLKDTGVRVVDLTPAAIGPYCVPVVNLDDHLHASNLNMVTCGGQATVPIVAAIAQAGIVSYAEIVSAISSQSAGPGTRASIDEFTETTAAALVAVGGAQRGRALIILNPADPPVMMRNTVYCLVDGESDHDAIESSVEAMVQRVGKTFPATGSSRECSSRGLRPITHFSSPKRESSAAPASLCYSRWPVPLTICPHMQATFIMTSAAKVTAERIASAETQIAGART